MISMTCQRLLFDGTDLFFQDGPSRQKACAVLELQQAGKAALPGLLTTDVSDGWDTHTPAKRSASGLTPGANARLQPWTQMSACSVSTSIAVIDEGTIRLVYLASTRHPFRRAAAAKAIKVLDCRAMQCRRAPDWRPGSHAVTGTCAWGRDLNTPLSYSPLHGKAKQSSC